MRVLVACEFSGVVRDAFLARGHDAWSCDLLGSERPGRHFMRRIEDVLNLEFHWDLMIAHPPCTYLTNSGVRHLHKTPKNPTEGKLYGPKRWVAMHEAALLFRMLQTCGIDKIAIENPIPHKYAKHMIGNYNQLVQPWQFGHGETKATCLWLKGLPKLKATNIVAGRESRIHKMALSKDRSKLRSVTYQGIADAMADQWG